MNVQQFARPAVFKLRRCQALPAFQGAKTLDRCGGAVVSCMPPKIESTPGLATVCMWASTKRLAPTALLIHSLRYFEST